MWRWFHQLDMGRSSGGMSINPIQYSEIKAYFELIGIEPFDWEVMVLKQIDNICLQAYHKGMKQSQAKASRKK